MNITIMESLGITQEELNTLKAPFEKMGCTFKCYEKQMTFISLSIKQRTLTQ